jgi:CBS domain-containing protein
MSAYKVKHYMQTDIPTIESNATASDAAKQMEKLGRGYLIVLKELTPAGIVTNRDIVNKVVAKDLDPKKVIVSEVMTSPLITVDPEDDIQKASELMQKNNVRRLPVVKGGIIYGVLTTADITFRFIDYVQQSTRELLKWAIPLGI